MFGNPITSRLLTSPPPPSIPPSVSLAFDVPVRTSRRLSQGFILWFLGGVAASPWLRDRKQTRAQNSRPAPPSFTSSQQIFLFSVPILNLLEATSHSLLSSSCHSFSLCLPPPISLRCFARNLPIPTLPRPPPIESGDYPVCVCLLLDAAGALLSRPPGFFVKPPPSHPRTTFTLSVPKGKDVCVCVSLHVSVYLPPHV